MLSVKMQVKIGTFVFLNLYSFIISLYFGINLVSYKVVYKQFHRKLKKVVVTEGTHTNLHSYFIQK